MNKPYTYLIGWTVHRKFYYGVRYAQNCHPDDLWIAYFTSSKKVNEFRAMYGEPDIIEVRKEFKSTQRARDWETNVLQRMKVVLREDFLNEHDSPAPPIRYGKRPAYVGEKISLRLQGKSKTAEHKDKVSKGVKAYYTDKPGPMTGKTHSDETKQVIREKRALQLYTEETKQKMRDHRENGRAIGMQDKNHSTSTKDKLSAANKGLKMFNNGKFNKKFFPGSEPSGFSLGSITKDTTNE